MEKMSRQLLSIVNKHEGKDFDATLLDHLDNKAGFSFMSYIKHAEIHIGRDRITISEPVTAKYFCLPLGGITAIQDESSGDQDFAYTIKYTNDYSVFIQIF